VLAGHARILGDNKQAIEAYEKLLEASAETDVRFDLARLYEETGSLDAAREHYLKVLEDDPRYIDALLATGRVEIRRGQPQSALEYLNRAHSLAIQFGNNEARGSILNAIGASYGNLNKREEALRSYQESLEIWQRLGQKGGMATSLSAIAQLNMAMGRPADALKNHQEALRLRREIVDNRGIGNTLAALGNLHYNRGDYDEAVTFYRQALQVQRELENKPAEALLLNNIGSVYFNKAQYGDALTNFERALALREELKNPAEIALTLRNVAEVNVKLGQYDAALPRYLRALDLSRNVGNKREVALASYAVGTLFEYQGRYGAALASKEEALKSYRELGDKGFWLGEMLSGHGSVLSQLGRFDEARQSLDEAMKLARGLNHQVLIGQTLNFQADTYYLAGDLAGARRLFDQALQMATMAKDRHLILLTRVNLAKLDAQERPAAAVAALRPLSQESESEGLIYLSSDASIHLGEALLRLKRFDEARRELDRALSRSERLGLRALVARSHYSIAAVLGTSGNTAEAARHQAEATRVLQEALKDTGVDTIRKRADLGPILAAAPAGR
jgi:tetratricopeptide (TPR) repeat protein